MNKIKLGILISGRGSNMQALINACKDNTFPAQVACVITNNGDALGIKQLEHPTFVIENKPLDVDRLDCILTQHKVDLVCLAGFMRILKDNFLCKWNNRVINVHPSLLPSFKGLNAQEQALRAGVKITGCTVHYVNHEVDSGAIIVQSPVPVLPHDDVETLSQRILIEEHKCYVKAVRLIAQSWNFFNNMNNK
ncbi:MAG: phosphoribosylglycinamide formyltransferase [Wolbachia endosymbiont of Fragariocoptes setiger]|nr:phosphoribosylglycinamide formyltransferase [Wolbachia endosymbiont of Fragariocoptes setiger]